MKNIFLCSAIFFYSMNTFSKDALYTSLSSSGDNVFAGVKISEKGEEPETYLLEVNAKKLSSGKVKLPDELSHREVVALLSTTGEEIVVVTQKTIEQGDNPLIHSYRPSSKKWSKLAEVKCMSFAKLDLTQTSVAFHCLETNDKGEEVERVEKANLAGVKLSLKGNLSLPQTKVDMKDFKAELVGDSFDWKELKVSAKSQEKVFRP